MYFDEDGDLAHEFYEEIVSSSTPRTRRKGKLRCRKMKKVSAKHLRPQGDVEYAIVTRHSQDRAETSLISCQSLQKAQKSS